MRTSATFALILAASFGHAAAQEVTTRSPWVETRFHRLHLRNGNFVDGSLIKETRCAVVLEVRAAGDFEVRWELIDHVELVCMRSLRLTPPPAAPEVSPEAAPEADAVGPKAPTPRAEEDSLALYPRELQNTVDAVIRSHSESTSDPREDLPSLLRALGPQGMSYACWVARNGDPDHGGPDLIEAIGALDCPDAQSSLTQISVTDPESSHRVAALRALARRGGPEAIGPLTRALGDGSGQVWRTASEEIAKLAQKGVVDVEAITALMRTMKDKSVPAQTLSKIGGSDAIAALGDLLRWGDDADKIAALRALFPFKRPVDGESAVLGLISRDADLRKESALFLGRIKYSPGVLPLIGALQDPVPSGADSALWALREITGLTYDRTPTLWSLWWEQAGKNQFPPQD